MLAGQNSRRHPKALANQRGEMMKADGVSQVTTAAPSITQRMHPPESIETDSPAVWDGEYRSKLVKLLADQARAELEASTIYSKWVHKAPGPEEKMHLVEIAHEETEHWYGTLKVLEGLGVSPEEAQLYADRNYFYAISYIVIPRYRWVDILMLTFLIDHGAYLLVEDFAQSSYAPWARFARKVLDEETGHMEFGNDFLREQVDKIGKAPVQRALNVWWRIALNMFGPPVSRHTRQYIRLGLKYRDNEERRSAFRLHCEARIRDLGLTVPKLYRDTYPFI
jgi:ring-1,2-phenylacetyl-CoA epoxidase subunit PaaA